MKAVGIFRYISHIHVTGKFNIKINGKIWCYFVCNKFILNNSLFYINMKKRAMLAELINRAKCKGHCKLLAYNCNCTVKLLFMCIYIYILNLIWIILVTFGTVVICF